jgi:hypothetical protein
MKYLKMVLFPLVMVAIAMGFFYLLAATSGIWQLACVALLIPIIALMFVWEFSMFKATADRIWAIVILVIVGAAVKICSIWVYGWPWVALGLPDPYPEAGLLSPVFRFYEAVFNPWALGGLLIGCAITVFAVLWLMRNKKI